MTHEGVRLLSAFAPPKRIWMKETKFAPPLFYTEAAAGVWGQHVPLSSLPSPVPKRIAIVPEGPPRGCSCARSLLSPAAWLARGFVFC